MGRLDAQRTRRIEAFGSAQRREACKDKESCLHVTSAQTLAAKEGKKYKKPIEPPLDLARTQVQSQHHLKFGIEQILSISSTLLSYFTPTLSSSTMASTQAGNDIVLVPADYVGAYYLEGAKDLYVIAQGVAYGGTTNIHIERDPDFVGGLRYFIKGDLQHVAGFEPYCIQYIEKDIKIPSKALPSKSIVVVDAKHLLGRVIEIQFYGLG